MSYVISLTVSDSGGVVDNPTSGGMMMIYRESFIVYRVMMTRLYPTNAYHRIRKVDKYPQALRLCTRRGNQFPCTALDYAHASYTILWWSWFQSVIHKAVYVRVSTGIQECPASGEILRFSPTERCRSVMPRVDLRLTCDIRRKGVAKLAVLRQS